ncbi:transcriptional regulator [Streptomyces sp. WAC 06783]|uniref:MmyB family transcriptional regulator n=1 Tax=Streptomyces sp. WAC 06783 TaxID=2203211 RepID=UPI000F740B12|nr:helix-turn-helix domain-containing protein [Streptomyces sp. WAC 06783]RSO11708.1 transcriptional regulator [Streptomyces sp. WAC 06783]
MSRKQRLGDFLRDWRAPRDPNQVPGFTAKFGHRDRLGITQAEMAVLTGVTEGWYRRLESGRIERPKTEWLERIVRILDLDEAQRHTLFVYARGQVPPPLYRPTGAVDPSTSALIQVQPWPAYLSDSAWDVLLYNAACEKDWPWMKHGINVMIWALTYPEARLQLINWEEDWAKPMASQLRLAAAEQPENRRLTEVVAEIKERDRIAARLLTDDLTTVTHPDGDRRWLYLPGHGDEEFEVTFRCFAPLSDRTQRLMLVVPSDYPVATEPAASGYAAAASRAMPSTSSNVVDGTPGTPASW